MDTELPSVQLPANADSERRASQVTVQDVHRRDVSAAVDSKPHGDRARAHATHAGYSHCAAHHAVRRLWPVADAGLRRERVCRNPGEQSAGHHRDAGHDPSNHVRHHSVRSRLREAVTRSNRVASCEAQAATNCQGVYPPAQCTQFCIDFTDIFPECADA